MVRPARHRLGRAGSVPNCLGSRQHWFADWRHRLLFHLLSHRITGNWLGTRWRWFNHALLEALPTCYYWTLERTQIIVANKMDMPEAEENLKEFKEKLAANYDEFDELPQIFPISSLAHQGLENLLEATAELLDQTDEFLLYNEDDMEQEEVYYGFNEEERPFEISRDDDASWVLSGEKLEKLFVMTNMERDESIMKFARQLRGMGVDEALRERGAKDGDIVRIGNFEFEFVD